MFNSIVTTATTIEKATVTIAIRDCASPVLYLRKPTLDYCLCEAVLTSRRLEMMDNTDEEIENMKLQQNTHALCLYQIYHTS